MPSEWYINKTECKYVAIYATYLIIHKKEYENKKRCDKNGTLITLANLVQLEILVRY